MKLELKAGNKQDIDDLVEMRLAFSLTMHPTEDEDEVSSLRLELEKYFLEKLEKNQYIGILGYFEEKLVCSAGLIVFEMPPTIGNHHRITGLVVNVYTKPEYRKKGFGEETIKFLIEIAREKGVEKLCLNATIEGESVYRKLGFKEDKYKELVLEI